MMAIRAPGTSSFHPAIVIQSNLISNLVNCSHVDVALLPVEVVLEADAHAALAPVLLIRHLTTRQAQSVSVSCS